jgi:1-acyl-sn-glycerol-3-phosphate acyltransferase
MNVLYKILGVQTMIDRFNKNVKLIGWHKANKQFISDFGISVINDVAEFSNKGPVLIFANHPTGIDPYLLSSVIKRDDLYFLADIYQAQKGKKIAEHIIPIFYDNWLEFYKRPLSGWFGYIWMRMTCGIVPREYARNHNRMAIKCAIDHLKKGHAVLIFPTAAEKNTRPWKNGIGYIIAGSLNKKTKFQLYSCSISGLSDLKIILHAFTKRSYLKKHPVNISIKDVSFNITNESDPVLITQLLYKLYNAKHIS